MVMAKAMLIFIEFLLNNITWKDLMIIYEFVAPTCNIMMKKERGH